MTGLTLLKRYEIINHPGVEYQHQVDVDYQTGLDSGFGNLRFTDQSGAELKYWVQEQTDGVIAKCWVKCIATTTMIEVQYADTGSLSLSNGKDTFPKLFDDFSNGTLDTSIWNDVTATVQIVDGKLEIVSTGSAWQYVRSSMEMYGYKVVVKHAHEVVTDNFHHSIQTASAYDRACVQGDGVSILRYQYRVNNSSTWLHSGSKALVANQYDISIVGVYDNKGYMEVEGIAPYVYSNANYDESGYSLYMYQYRNTKTYVDWVFAKTYVVTEPTLEEMIDTSLWTVIDTVTVVNVKDTDKVQARMYVPWRTGLDADFNNLGFMHNTGAHIKHWLESKVDGVYAWVWVLLPMNTLTFKFAYAPTGGVSVSTEDAKPFIYEMFGTLNTTDFSVSATAARVENDMLVMDPLEHGWTHQFISTVEVPRPFTARFNFKYTGTYYQFIMGIFGSDTGILLANMLYGYQEASSWAKAYIYEDNASRGTIGFVRDPNNWHEYRFNVKSAGCQYIQDDVLLYNSSYSSEDLLRVGFNEYRNEAVDYMSELIVTGYYEGDTPIPVILTDDVDVYADVLSGSDKNEIGPVKITQSNLFTATNLSKLGFIELEHPIYTACDRNLWDVIIELVQYLHTDHDALSSGEIAIEAEIKTLIPMAIFRILTWGEEQANV